MKGKYRILAMVLALVLLLPLGVLSCGVLLPEYYGESYYAQLPALYQRLYSVEGKKIVVIGGSNVAFGLDTALLEKLLAQKGQEYTVCSFGLYAAVGTSAMLDLAQNALNAGDIVVLAIEPTSETMSTYFGAEAFWKCCEEMPEMILDLGQEKQNAMAGTYVSYLQERVSILRSANLPRVDGVYAKASFDERGNMIYDRAGNAMPLGFDTSAPVDLDVLVIQPEFADQVNEFCGAAQEKGVEVFLSFSPVNRSALVDETGLEDYFRLCNETFSCSVISDPGDYVFDSGWFYDNNFHLNSAGAVLRTVQLAGDLLAQLGCYEAVEYALPEMPESISRPVENNGEERFFLFEPMDGGWLISGLSEEGMAESALTVPAAKDGAPVVGFAADALSGARQLRELTLPESIESLPDGLFSRCSALERLVLEHREQLCAIGDAPFAGAEQLRIFVPTESYPLYRDGDGCEANPWSDYLSRIYTFG